MMRFLRRYKDLGISGLTARWYDKNSRHHRIDELRSYAEEVAKHIENGNSVLEVAPGPGYLAIELAKLGSYNIIGLDISQDFVDIARTNAQQAGVAIEFRQGNVADMTFSDALFDFIICTAAFKNFKEPLKAVNAMHRVLKPGATALIIDLNRNVSNRQLENLIREMNVKGTEALFMKLAFKYFLRRGAYSEDGFVKIILKSEFKNFTIKEVGVGLYVYLHKQT
jgi:ubiquinone/menaquinone biosynthesis C-methylase UbiE